MKIVTTIEVPDTAFDAVVKEVVRNEGRLLRPAAAELAHLSLSAFTGEFKKAYGLTFREFQIRIRLVVAIELLVQTSLRISEIADRIGYSDIGKFEKMFKRYLKLTPRLFRGKYQAGIMTSTWKIIDAELAESGQAQLFAPLAANLFVNQYEQITRT